MSDYILPTKDSPYTRKAVSSATKDGIVIIVIGDHLLTANHEPAFTP